MLTDRLRLETGLLTRTEKLRYACELLADAAQVEPQRELQNELRAVILTVRGLLESYRW